MNAQDAALPRKVNLPGESRQAGVRLRSADSLINPCQSPERMACLMGQLALPSGAVIPWPSLLGVVGELVSWDPWNQALDEYQQLMMDLGDELALAAGDFPSGIRGSSHQVRWACQERLSRLPPLVRERYRAQVRGAADLLLNEGVRQRSPELLLRVVETYFNSSAGEKALDLLGDLAFDRGSFEEARFWWGRLAPWPLEENGKKRHGLQFPDPANPSLIQAKQILAQAFAGAWREAKAEAKQFRSAHGQARGFLAGRQGILADILDEEVRRLILLASQSHDLSWPTFGGSATRQRPLAHLPSPRLWVDGPTWRVALPGASVDAQVPPGRFGKPPRTPFHPIIAHDLVLLADAQSVWAHDLWSGQKRGAYSLPGVKEAESESGEAAVSVAAGRVFARLGPWRLAKSANSRKATEDSSCLVCLTLPGVNSAKDLKEIWRATARGPGGQAAVFASEPVAVEQRVWAAVSWIAGSEVATALVCYHARDGTVLWRQTLCSNQGESFAEARQYPLTWAGDLLVFTSPAGAVVAVEPGGGKIRWAARIPVRSDEDGTEAVRNPLSAAADGRLILALPSGGLAALAIADGRRLWQREGVDVVHLLGVQHDKVVFTTPAGLRAVGVADGSDEQGWQVPAEGSLPSLGRGLLTGNWILWPTRDPLLPCRAVSSADGGADLLASQDNPFREPESLEPTRLRRLLAGNMAIGQGCVVVAGVNELAAYVPPEHFLQIRKEKAQAEATLANRYRLAMAQIGIGEKTEGKAILDDLTKLPLTQRHHGAWKILAEQRLHELKGEKSASREVQRPEAKRVVDSAPSADAHSAPKNVIRWHTDSGRLVVPVGKAPLEEKDSLVLLHDAGSLTARDVRTGAVRWRQPWAESLAWLGVHEKRVFLAGPHAIICLRREDGNLAWSFANPSIAEASLVGDVPALDAPVDCLTGFHLKNGHLLFFHGQRRLVALDLQTGQAAWQVWAPAGRDRPLYDAGLFHPSLAADEACVGVQTNTRKCWLLDPLTGKKVKEMPAGYLPWPGPPVSLGAGRFAVPDDRGSVACMKNRLFWTYAHQEESCLTGAPPLVFGTKACLLALIPTNLGQSLVRLDAETGKSIWSLESGPFRHLTPQSMTFDDNALFLVHRNTLQAIALKDGKLVWQKALPDSFPSWHVARTADAVVVLPRLELPIPWLPTDQSPLTWAAVERFTRKPLSTIRLTAFQPQSGAELLGVELAKSRGPTALQVLPDGVAVGVGAQSWIVNLGK